MHHEYGTFNFYSAGKGGQEQKALLFLSSYLLANSSQPRRRASCLYDMRDLISKGEVQYHIPYWRYMHTHQTVGDLQNKVII